MSIKTDLVLVYQMGYADALGRRKPEPSKAEDMADSIARENARLREQIEVFFDAMHKSATDNDKLRELVRDMWSHDYARHFSTLGSDVEHRESVWRRMRELGIKEDA